jgi:hypothetical protein
MAYVHPMWTRPVTVAETGALMRQAGAQRDDLSPDARRAVQALTASLKAARRR